MERGAYQREQRIHDRWASEYDPRSALVMESFSVPSCPENQFILPCLGDLNGKRILELGAGLGEASVFFAKQGAVVTATDLSSGCLQVARQVASLNGVQIRTVQTSADRLSFADSSFDIVYAANVLHHVDTKKCLLEIYRVLNPGGIAAFFDPICYNPLINVYRRMAHQVRSPDEHPLGRRELKLMHTLFPNLQVRFFWFATLAVFLKFYLIDQIHPNQERYWKKVIYDFEKIRGLFLLLNRFDNFFLKLPLFRWLAWNMAVVVRK